MKLSNAEIANSVIEKHPELDFYKVLDDIDITRTPAQEARFISKTQSEELISEYLVFFETKIEAEE
jgi:hypothetical protein